MPERLKSAGRLAVGLISGTSMDGVDAALVRLGGPAEKPRVQLLAFSTAPYPKAVVRKLLAIAGGRSTSAGEISQLNFLLGELFAEAALKVCRQAGVRPRRLEVIGSHGQTIYHQGLPTTIGGRRTSSTLQIGEPSVIAARTGATVVADFRTADLAAGGQGAPLVPLVDYLLLRHPRQGRVALNIGGIANVTVIPARARPDQVFGFDTGPGNMVIDGLVRHFTAGRQKYDVQGRLAAQGKVIESLLARILRVAFFRRLPPKSAGREQFGSDFLSHYFFSGRLASVADLVRTATELTARTIAEALERLVFPRAKVHRLIVSGGGAHNRLLLSRLRELLPGLPIELSDLYGLPIKAKEAIAFALLADRSLRRLPGNLPRVTGAERALVLGKIIRP